MAAIAAKPSVTAVGVVHGSRNLSPEERLDLLDLRVYGVEQPISGTAAKIEQDVAKMAGDLADANLEHERDVDALHARLTVAEDEAAMVDALPIPVVPIGVVLSAADSIPATPPVWLSAFVTAGP